MTIKTFVLRAKKKKSHSIYFLQICYYCYGSNGSTINGLPRANVKFVRRKFFENGTKTTGNDRSRIANPCNPISKFILSQYLYTQYTTIYSWLLLVMFEKQSCYEVNQL